MNTVNGAVYFHYDGNTTNVLYETDANNVVKVQYTYDSNGNRISMTYNGQTYFYQYNGHGDVVGLTDSTGAVVATYDYDAFGNPVGTAPTPGSVGDVNPYRYAGYRWDKDTTLYYLNARYYWAGLGRFITRDADQGALEDVFSLNLYNYCNSNPVNFTDDGGQYPKPITYNTKKQKWSIDPNQYDSKIAYWTDWYNRSYTSISKTDPLDPSLVKALIYSESTFDTNKGKKNGYYDSTRKIKGYAVGLGQLTKPAIQDLAEWGLSLIVNSYRDDRTDPNLNIRATIKFLFMARIRYKKPSWLKAIAYYKYSDSLAQKPWNYYKNPAKYNLI